MRDRRWRTSSRRPGGWAPISVERRPHRRGPRGGTRRAARRRRRRRRPRRSSPLATTSASSSSRSRQRQPEGVEAGPEVGRGRRDRDPRPGRRRRSPRAQASPAAAAAAAHVGVDHGVDDRAPLSAKPSSAVDGVLEPVAGDGDRDRAAAVRLAAGELLEQPGDAGRRGGLDEDAVAGGELALRGEDLVVGDRRERGRRTRRARPRRASTRPGCRSGSRSPGSPGRGTARRSPAARRPRPGSRASPASWWPSPRSAYCV